jgi:hypothetical protein
MAKKFRGLGGKSFSNKNMSKLLKEAQKMQEELKQRMNELEEKLENLEIVKSVGGGAVLIKMNGHYKVKEINIEPELIKDDPEMVTDLLIAAFNDAVDEAKKIYDEEMKKINPNIAAEGLGFSDII